MPRLHSGAKVDRPETNNTTFPPFSEVVWQQPQETHLNFILANSITETHKSTRKPELNQKNVVESQRSPIRQISRQVSGSDTESFLGCPTRSTPVQCLNDSHGS